jgi:riboflavin kinase/FMN adenylyltransferase
MIVRETLSAKADDSRPAICSVGTFDGVHLGHQRLIGRMVEWAVGIGGRTVLLTFSRNPQSALKPGTGGMNLTDTEEKLGLFETLGVDEAVVLQFTAELAGTGPEDFVRNRLVPALNPAGLVLGPGHRFGRDRGGSPELLSDLADQLGFTVRQVPGVEIDGDLVSSTRVRRLIDAGDLEPACRCLGRPYKLTGSVISGDRQGAELGYPTANLELKGEEKVLPPDGVYVVRAALEKQMRGGMMYIGNRPTFGSKTRQFEVHLFDFDGRLYGRRLEVLLLSRLRRDKSFPDVESLKARMRLDESQAREKLKQECAEVSPRELLHGT